MAEYHVTFARSARKELEALDAALVARIFPRIERLAGNPRPMNAIKVKGHGTYGVFASAATGLFTQSMIAIGSWISWP